MSEIDILIVCLTVLISLTVAAATVSAVAKNVTATRLGVSDRADECTAADFGAAIAALQRASARLAPPDHATGHLVTVLTRDEQTLHGVLLEEYPDRLLLADAHLVTAQGKTPIPGRRIRVYRDRIVLVQEHEDPTAMQGE